MVIEFRLGLQVKEAPPYVIVVYNSPRGRFLINCGRYEAFPYEGVFFPDVGVNYMFLQKECPIEPVFEPLPFTANWDERLKPYTEIGDWWYSCTKNFPLLSVYAPYEHHILSHFVRDLPLITAVIDMYERKTDVPRVNKIHTLNL